MASKEELLEKVKKQQQEEFQQSLVLLEKLSKRIKDKYVFSDWGTCSHSKDEGATYLNCWNDEWEYRLYLEDGRVEKIKRENQG